MDCPGVEPAKVPQFEVRARQMDAELERAITQPDVERFSDTKLAAKKLLEEALALPREEQLCLLKAAQIDNDELRRTEPDLPSINVVFSHKSGDLARFQFSYPHIRDSGILSSLWTPAESRETIDLFAP